MKEKFDISKFKPSKELEEYYASQPDFATFWNNCERGDWMLWIAYKLGVNDRALTLAKAHCVNTVRHLMQDERSVAAVDASIKYGNGEIDREELNKAASAADDAAVWSTASAVVADDAFAAYYAALAAASAAASAAYYTAFAADYTAFAADAKKASQQETADICRKYLSEEVFKLVKESERNVKVTLRTK